ncbi:unnamed protein product [Closterium sp. NIES-54]
MDAEMASSKSTDTYVDVVPPLGANIVDGMWIFREKRPQGSPPTFEASYVARGFSQRLKPVTPRAGSRRSGCATHPPLGVTGSIPAGTQWSLRRPVYGLRQAPREWHDSVRTTLAVLGVYRHLVFATADTEVLVLVKAELQERLTCTNLGEIRNYLGLQITQDRARHTITLTQSHMVHQVLQCFGFQFSSPQPTPLSTSCSLSAPPSDESAHNLTLRTLSASWLAIWLPVDTKSCEAEIYAGAIAAQELRWLTYLLTDLPLPLPAPAPHTEVSESLTERREPETRASTPVRAHRVARPRPLAVLGTHGMTLRPSSVPQRVLPVKKHE